MNWVERQLQDISLDEVLRFVATWLHELHRSGADVRRADSLAADTWFEPGTREKVKDLCQRGGRTLVTPQSLFVLAKMACSAAADASAEVNPAILVGGLLAISQDLGLSRENGAADPSLGLVGQELIANQLFNRNPNQANIMAGFVRRWLQLPASWPRSASHRSCRCVSASYWRVADRPADYRHRTVVLFPQRPEVADSPRILRAARLESRTARSNPRFDLCRHDTASVDSPTRSAGSACRGRYQPSSGFP